MLPSFASRGVRAVTVSSRDESIASFFPSSAAVNPGLTIVAQALRVADHIRRTEVTPQAVASHDPASRLQ